MTKPYLFDSSAILALIKNEQRGAVLLERGERDVPIIDTAAIHAVQVAEVVKKLADAGKDVEVAREWVDDLNLEVLMDVELYDAFNTARLCPKQWGLSLGDRICLSIALRFNQIAVTTDERWKQVADEHPDLGLQVMHLKSV